MSKLARLVDCGVIVHEPNPSAVSAAVPAVAPKMTPGRATLVELARKCLGAMHALYITILEVHKERIGRVLDLCEGFESPDGLELLASVHIRNILN